MRWFSDESAAPVVRFCRIKLLIGAQSNSLTHTHTHTCSLLYDRQVGNRVGCCCCVLCVCQPLNNWHKSHRSVVVMLGLYCRRRMNDMRLLRRRRRHRQNSKIDFHFQHIRGTAALTSKAARMCARVFEWLCCAVTVAFVKFLWHASLHYCTYRVDGWMACVGSGFIGFYSFSMVVELVVNGARACVECEFQVCVCV